MKQRALAVGSALPTVSGGDPSSTLLEDFFNFISSPGLSHQRGGDSLGTPCTLKHGPRGSAGHRPVVQRKSAPALAPGAATRKEPWSLGRICSSVTLHLVVPH